MSLEDEDDRTKEKDIEAGVDLDIQEEATDQAPHDQEIATEEGITIVTWDSPSDPAKPTNWPTTLRWTLISLCTAVVFCGGISSSIFAPGVPQLMKEFNSSSDILAIFVVSVYVLGLGTGPAIFAPLSEIYGRLPVQHVGNIGFLGFTIACALATNLKMLIGFRLLQGVFAAVPLTNGGGIIAGKL